MKKINKSFHIIGTNLDSYLQRYLAHLNEVPINSTLKIHREEESAKILHNSFEVGLDFTSKTTLEQFLLFAKTFELVLQIDDETLVKRVPELREVEIMEIIKSLLLSHCYLYDSKTNNKVNKLRDTTIYKIIYSHNPTLLENNLPYCQRNKQLIALEKIRKETGQFEKKILKDKKFVSLIEAFWKESKND